MDCNGFVIPPSVQILHLTFEVKELPADKMPKSELGNIDFSTNTICILDSQPAQSKLDTLIHELVHGHLYLMGQDDSEEIVIATTTAVLTFLRLNQQLIPAFR